MLLSRPTELDDVMICLVNSDSASSSTKDNSSCNCACQAPPPVAGMASTRPDIDVDIGNLRMAGIVAERDAVNTEDMRR